MKRTICNSRKAVSSSFQQRNIPKMKKIFSHTPQSIQSLTTSVHLKQFPIATAFHSKTTFLPQKDSSKPNILKASFLRNRFGEGISLGLSSRQFANNKNVSTPKPQTTLFTKPIWKTSYHCSKRNFDSPDHRLLQEIEKEHILKLQKAYSLVNEHVADIPQRKELIEKIHEIGQQDKVLIESLSAMRTDLFVAQQDIKHFQEIDPQLRPQLESDKIYLKSSYTSTDGVHNIELKDYSYFRYSRTSGYITLGTLTAVNVVIWFYGLILLMATTKKLNDEYKGNPPDEDTRARLLLSSEMFAPFKKYFIHCAGDIQDNPKTLLGSCFSHLDLNHILSNMFFLWTFGNHLHKFIGPTNFVALYIFGGFLGALSTSAFFFKEISLDEQSVPRIVPADPKLTNISSLGASGSVMAIMALSLCLFPRKRFQLSRMAYLSKILMKKRNSETNFLRITRIPAYLAVPAYLALDVSGITSGENDGVNHYAHLGGALGGILFHLLLTRRLKQKTKPVFYPKNHFKND